MVGIVAEDDVVGLEVELGNNAVLSIVIWPGAQLGHPDEELMDELEAGRAVRDAGIDFDNAVHAL